MSVHGTERRTRRGAEPEKTAAEPRGATKKKTYPPAEQFFPSVRSLPALREAARGCMACPLYEPATQAVFGEGPSDASIAIVGEQPGDVEDKAGRPFVGPAGRILDDALAESGIDRAKVYVTNAVKHFNFEQRGKARIHKKPKPGDVRACRPWLAAELGVVRPTVVVLLGATAAQSLLGPMFRVTEMRGKPLDNDIAPVVVATVHPSSILRAPDSKSRHKAYEQFVRDLRVAADEAKRRVGR